MNKEQLKDKVEGMFWGIAIGDALGRAVETFTKEEIRQYLQKKGIDDGIIKVYYRPDGHKWFDGQEAGGITDDTELSIAVAKGLMESGLDIASQAKFHAEAYTANPNAGYGTATRTVIRELANGCRWYKTTPTFGVGNGMPMKIAPIAAYNRLNVGSNLLRKEWFHIQEHYATFMKRLCALTHRNDLSLAATFAHYTAVYECLSKKSPTDFDAEHFIKMVTAAGLSSKFYLSAEDAFQKVDDKIEDRLAALSNCSKMSEDEVITEMGGGTCYVYNSLPFTYAFFLRNPQSIDSLYQVVSAGGDTDSNGSMLGALLGALHGKSIFPQHLIDGLLDKSRVETIAKEFVEKSFSN